MTTTEKVYADGYGRWHVIVKDSAYGLQHAIYAIASELQERSAHGTDPVDVLHYVNDNIVSIPDAEPGYIHFAEYSILGN
jgi:hypothetical protein